MDEIFIRSGNCKTMEYVGEERSLLLCAGQNRRGVFDGQNVDGRSIEKLATFYGSADLRARRFSTL